MQMAYTTPPQHNHSPLLSYLLLLILLLTTTPHPSTAATTPHPPPLPPAAICNSTLYPTYCRNILTSDNSTTATVYEYGVFSVKRSIKQATRFHNLVNRHLSKARHLRLTPTAVLALQDCRTLTELNLDFLAESYRTVNGANRTLSATVGDDVQTRLSAIVTNQQTCLDGLESTAAAWSGRGGIVEPLGEDSKLYSVALGIVTKGWVPNAKKKPIKYCGGGGGRGGRGGGGGGGCSNSRIHHSASTSSHADVTITVGGGGVTISDAAKQILVNSRGSKNPAATATYEVGNGQAGPAEIGAVVVSKDGTGNFATIGEAVDAAPNRTADASDNGYFLIYVKEGVYEEYVSIDKKKAYILMVGDGINRTVITGNRSVNGGWTTFRSATLAVVGTGFVAVNITVRNTAGPSNGQAVAVRSGADLSAFYSCSFEGYQDTLYVHSMRQFYRDCHIYGTVDFIFGNAAVVFQNCNIYPRRPLDGQFNAVTAQGRTDPNQNTGISIHNCTVSPSPDLAALAAAGGGGKVRTYLGRPWKEYSRTVYLESYMDGFIEPAGWAKWTGEFALDTLYYGEYGNTGPGSGTAGRVNWVGYHVMNATDAGNFTASSFLLADAWLPQTGVTYVSGLI